MAINARPSTGFQKNPAQPFCSARSRMTASWLAVVTMIGGAVPASLSRCCSSMPDIPGRPTSTTTHSGFGDASMYASAEFEKCRLETPSEEETAQRFARWAVVLHDGHDGGRLRRTHVMLLL